MTGADPVDNAFGLRTTFGLHAVTRGLVVGAAEFGDVASVIFDDLLADDAEGEFEADLAAGLQAMEPIDGHFHEVIGFDVDFTAERHLPCACGGIFGMIGGLEILDFVFGVVFDDDFDRAQHAIGTAGDLVEILADGVIEQGDLGERVELREADGFAEAANGGGVMPRRRMPLMVGMRGSSQPLTRPSLTRRSSLRLLMTV